MPKWTYEDLMLGDDGKLDIARAARIGRILIRDEEENRQVAVIELGPRPASIHDPSPQRLCEWMKNRHAQMLADAKLICQAAEGFEWGN